MAQHLCAARIGGDKPAHCRHALAAQREGKAQARAGRSLVQIMQHHARAAGDLAAIAIHRADSIQPPQRDQQRCAAGIGRGPARHPAVAPLRHDGHAMRGAELHQLGKLRRAGGGGEGEGAASVARAPVGEPGGEKIRVLRQATGPEQRGGLAKKFFRPGGVLTRGALRHARPMPHRPG